jgi:protein SCO1/2
MNCHQPRRLRAVLARHALARHAPAWHALVRPVLVLTACCAAATALAQVQPEAPRAASAAAHAAVPAADDDSAARAAPRYLLQGPNGRAATSEDFRGRFQLVAFGFTSCPDVCPTTLLEVQQLLQALGPDAAKVQALFITVDPQRDTPAVLKEYTAAFDPRILGLSGSPELVARAAQAFGVQYRKSRSPDAPENVYTVDHSTGMVLLGPEGQWLRRIGYGTPVPRMLEMLQRALRGEAP